MTVTTRNKNSRRGYTPPPVPLVTRILLRSCDNCRKVRQCATLGTDSVFISLCHDCCLAIAEHLSGVKWLNNWKGIKAAQKVRSDLAKQRRADLAE